MERPIQSYTAIAEYFGKTKGWLTGDSYIPIKRILLEKYGEISISSIAQYLDYQGKLVFTCQGILNSKILTIPEIKEQLNLKSAYSFIYCVNSYRKESDLIDYRLIGKMEDIVEFGIQKIEYIIKEKEEELLAYKELCSIKNEM